MKRLMIFGLVALGAVSVSAQQPLRVAMVYDAGGKFDRSFNQSAHEGSMRAVRDFGIQVRDFEPSEGGQTVGGIRNFARERFDLIVGVGFANEAAITSVARENPRTYFGLVDSVSDAPNVASLIFKEHEGSFLVGYLAGLNTSTNVVGFMGGMDIPLIHKFEAGFRAGVRAASPNAQVIVQYVGTTPDAWNNPGRAKEIAAGMRTRGADIIYSAAGASGNGVIEYVNQQQCLRADQLPRGVTFRNNNFANVPKSAAYQRACAGNTRPMFFIGVDSNQNRLGDTDNNPNTLNHGLTSMVKRVDAAVYALIREVGQDRFKGGERVFGLRENGVTYALDAYNQALIPQAQRDRLARIRAGIISGQIRVPSSR